MESNLNEYYGSHYSKRYKRPMPKIKYVALVKQIEIRKTSAFTRSSSREKKMNMWNKDVENKSRLRSGLNKVKNTNISWNICVMYCTCAYPKINCLSLQSIFFHYLFWGKWLLLLLDSLVRQKHIRLESMRILFWSLRWSITGDLKKCASFILVKTKRIMCLYMAWTILYDNSSLKENSF